MHLFITFILTVANFVLADDRHARRHGSSVAQSWCVNCFGGSKRKLVDEIYMTEQEAYTLFEQQFATHYAGGHVLFLFLCFWFFVGVFRCRGRRQSVAPRSSAVEVEEGA